MASQGEISFVAGAVATITVPSTGAKPSHKNKCAHNHIAHHDIAIRKFEPALPEKRKKIFGRSTPAERRAGVLTNSLRPLANGDARQFSMKATKENFTRLSPIWVRGRLNLAASEKPSPLS
jgi:hypothetical protein